MKKKKNTNRLAGFVLLVVSVAAFAIYAYLLLTTEFGVIVLKLTVLGAVATLLAVLGWIGYTIVTAPASG